MDYIAWMKLRRRILQGIYLPSTAAAASAFHSQCAVFCSRCSISWKFAIVHVSQASTYCLAWLCGLETCPKLFTIYASQRETWIPAPYLVGHMLLQFWQVCSTHATFPPPQISTKVLAVVLVKNLVLFVSSIEMLCNVMFWWRIMLKYTCFCVCDVNIYIWNLIDAVSSFSLPSMYLFFMQPFETAISRTLLIILNFLLWKYYWRKNSVDQELYVVLFYSCVDVKVEQVS